MGICPKCNKDTMKYKNRSSGAGRSETVGVCSNCGFTFNPNTKSGRRIAVKMNRKQMTFMQKLKHDWIWIVLLIAFIVYMVSGKK